MVYCSGSVKATIDIVFPEKLRVITFKPPVNVIVEFAKSENYEIFSHSMAAPMNKLFKQEIHSVESNNSPGYQWCYGTAHSLGENNPPNDLMTSCPLVGRAVVFGAEGLIIEGKRLHSNFDVTTDGSPAYFNNYGVCSYKVYFSAFKLTIQDSTGIIFERVYQKKPLFEVSCDNRCPPGYLECLITKYPGYCCIPCKPTAAKIAAIKEQVRRFNRG